MFPVGKISKPFGLGGELLVNLYDTFPAEPNKEEPLYVRIDTLAVPLFIDRFERRGRTGALVRFADIDSEVRASELVGLECYLREADDEQEGPEGAEDEELYFEDLIGFQAVLNEKLTGFVEDFIDNDMNPLLVIRIKNQSQQEETSAEADPGHEIFIPATDEFIAELDEETRTIVFDLPEGLLDLYV